MSASRADASKPAPRTSPARSPAREAAEEAPRDARAGGASVELAPADPTVVRATPTPPSPRSVTEARDRIETTRQRLATTAEQLKRRVEVERVRMEGRLDIAARVRRAIAGRELWVLGGAFVTGLGLAWLRRKARLDDEDRAALHAWNEDRERVLAALGLLDEDD